MTTEDLSRLLRMLVFAVFVAAVLAGPLSAGGGLVVRVQDGGSAGIGAYDVGRSPTLAGAVASLGEPTACEPVPGLPTFVRVRWSRLSLGMRFGTYGALTRPPCRARAALRFDSAVLGRGWRTAVGLAVGDREARIGRLYPAASRHGDRRWLVIRRQSVPERRRVPALAAAVRGGRVTALVVSLQLEGD